MIFKKKEQNRKMLVTINYKTEYQNGEIEWHLTPEAPRYERGMKTSVIRNITPQYQEEERK